MRQIHKPSNIELSILYIYDVSEGRHVQGCGCGGDCGGGTHPYLKFKKALSKRSL